MDDMAAAPRSRPGSVVAIIPIRSLETAKSRLGGPLDAEERQALVRELLERTVRAAVATAGIDEVIVVSDDRNLRALGRSFGATAIADPGTDLNAALTLARRAAAERGAWASLALPADLARVSPAAIQGVLVAARGAASEAGSRRPVVVLVPDRHGQGTNALLMAPADAIPFAFGERSRERHASLAAAVGAVYRELPDSPLALDVDTADDLLLAAGAPAESAP